MDARVKRNCLRCDREFKSVDKCRNRICQHCHRKDVYQPPEYKVPGTDRRRKGEEL